VHRIAERVSQRGLLKVQEFTSKQHLKSWAKRIGDAYNKTFVNNWEYYPFSEKEVKYIADTLMAVADHRLIKIMTYKDDVVGFALGFPDVSAALQRAKGHLLPFGILDLMLEMRRTKWISMNGIGVLPEFQGHGGNALMYAEMEKTLGDYNFMHGELTQVAETAVQMRHDLMNLGGKPYKNHRVYIRHL
jgi:hypothetical protein